MRINYNAAAMRANNALNASDSKVSKSLQRLSSGLKITEAKENPSGYAIARRMNTQIIGISEATTSANNGISVIETADGALSEVHSILQRMNELAVKGATGTLTSTDSEMLNSEMKQLKEEVTRIGQDTEFNGQPILDGTFDLRGYTDNKSVDVDYYSDEVLAKEYTISALNIQYDNDGKISTATCTLDTTANGGFTKDVQLTSIDGDKLTFTGNQDFEITLKIEKPTAQYDTKGNLTGYTPTSRSFTNLKLNITGIGAMDTQIGANEGQQLAIRIPTITLDRMGIEDTDVSSQESSTAAIDEVKEAILYVSDARSRLGAYQNRLEHTISNLDISSENMTSSYSRIMDVDMAEEMTSYTTQQVISQAATSMLAQANERPSQVLQLLQ